MKYIFLLFIFIIIFIFAIGLKTYFSINNALSYYEQPSQEKPSAEQIRADFNQLFKKQNRSLAQIQDRNFSEENEYKENNESFRKEKEAKNYREHLDDLRRLSVQSLDCNDYDMCVLELRNRFFSIEQSFVSEDGQMLSPEKSIYSNEMINLYNQKLNELKEIFPE